MTTTALPLPLDEAARLIQPVPLSELVQPLVNAQVALTSAEADVVLDKASRQGRLLALAADFLFTTDAERKRDQAKEALAELTASSKTTVIEWVEERVEATATSDASAGPALADARARQADLNRRYRTVHNAMEKGWVALRTLKDAKSACSSASTTEAFDLLSKSKAVSVLSSMSTSDANESLKKAQTAVTAFRELFPAAGEAPADQVDDTLDLILDFTLELPFDFTSWANMSSLDTAAANCARAIERIECAMRPLCAEDAELSKQRTLCAREIAAILVPFRFAARAELPTLLRELAPKD